MNFFSWEFSEEAQPELNKFLQVVNQNKNEKCKLEEKMFEIYPELKVLYEDFEKSKIFVENQEGPGTPDDVIMIDDDERDTIIQQEIKTELPDMSLLNLTQANVNLLEEDTLNEEVHVFIEYLLECLENENLLLEKEHVLKLVNDFNYYSLNYILNKLVEMSDNGVDNLNKSICKHCDVPLKNIPELFCKLILFSKFQNSKPSNKMLAIMKEFGDTYPDIARQELIILLLVPDSGNVNFFQTILPMLSQSEKTFLVRDFVYMASEIESSQLEIIESLLSFVTDDTVMRRLINLMEVSADKFKTEKLFMKLLITIINSLKTEFEDQQQIIFHIIEKSKTANKKIAQKAFTKWTSNFNVSFM